MKLQYIDGEGAEHTMTFHEDDLAEALQDATDDGATQATDVETGQVYNLDTGAVS